MKYCPECGRTGTTWTVIDGVDTCPCGEVYLRELSDELISFEFLSLIENQYTPFDRHALEAMALLEEE